MLDIQKLREKNLTFDKLKGKTIAKVSCRFESMIISFTDGTFTAIDADYGGESAEIIHDISPNLALLARVGVITEEELNEYEKYRQEQRNLAAEKRERELFDQLKAKYDKQ